ncbi:hypothetical protein [Nitrosopumilus ureiphilus]|uniref:Uncharacterized protein n=1 Tax=Nitrosopumilus ureiphilus TaxID=1470067 RepID=A0A7D5RAN5_9ARCH|nr:hypothetical protein [Nitrosopumilus ureiphilus]QLH06322.1 hypothetical protein C5F50_03955 [Nitrosopumilus ureiphilus]
MLASQYETKDPMIQEMLDAPLGHIVTALGNHLNCKIKLELIAQNTPKPGTEFERKILVTANNLPLIKAIIKFDRKILPESITSQLLQKRRLVGTILNLNNIPNDKNITFFNVEKEKISREYQIKNGKDIFFEVSEAIRTDYINVLRKEFGVKGTKTKSS